MGNGSLPTPPPSYPPSPSSPRPDHASVPMLGQDREEEKRLLEAREKDRDRHGGAPAKEEESPPSRLAVMATVSFYLVAALVVSAMLSLFSAARGILVR